MKVLHNSVEREASVEDLGTEVVVTLTNVSGRDEGEYNVLLENTIGLAGSSEVVQVSVVMAPEMRLGLVGLQSEGVRLVERSDSNLTLSCRQSRPGQAVRSVDWFMDNILLYSLPNCDQPASNLCQVDPTKLFLENINRHFHGNFSCVGVLASGLRSSMSNSVSVTVLFPPGSASITTSGSEPLYSGDTVTFSCRVREQGRPGVESYVWRLGGRELPQQTSPDLTVTLSDSEDNTSVSCAGYNEAGAGPPADLQLRVARGPRLTLGLPPRTSVQETGPLELVCTVTCSPQGRIDNISIPHISQWSSFYSIHIIKTLATVSSPLVQRREAY